MYGDLAINLPKATDQVPSYHPSPREYDTITREDLVALRQKNRDLVKKLNDTERAPQLVKNLVSELEQANNRVKELQRMLKEHPGDDNKEEMADKLRDTNVRVGKLDERLEEVRRKNLALERQLNTKPHLEQEFTKAVKEMDLVLQKLAFTKHRSKLMEENLKNARQKNNELRAARRQVTSMKRELDAANYQLEKLGRMMGDAQNKWNNRPRSFTNVRADGSSYGQMTAKKTDIHGRPTRDGIKVVEFKDKGKSNKYAKDNDYTNRSLKEVELIRSLEQLEGSIGSVDRLNKALVDENTKMADEVKTLMQIMMKKGISLTPEQMKR